MALTCNENRLTTPDDARLLLTLALGLAPGARLKAPCPQPRHDSPGTIELLLPEW
jgi:hypothetical protein